MCVVNTYVVVVMRVGNCVVGIVVVDPVSDGLVVNSGQISRIPALSTAADVGFIMDIGSTCGEGHEGMPILVDSDTLVFAADVGLLEMELHCT